MTPQRESKAARLYRFARSTEFALDKVQRLHPLTVEEDKAFKRVANILSAIQTEALEIAHEQALKGDDTWRPKNTREALKDAHATMHVLEQLLADIIRKYGDEHRSALLTPVDMQGRLSIVMEQQGENLLLEIQESGECQCGFYESHTEDKGQ